MKNCKPNLKRCYSWGATKKKQFHTISDVLHNFYLHILLIFSNILVFSNLNWHSQPSKGILDCIYSKISNNYFEDCMREIFFNEKQQWTTVFALVYVLPAPLKIFQIIPTIEQKIKFSIKEFFSKYDQIRSFRLISSHLLKKPLTENFIFL